MKSRSWLAPLKALATSVRAVLSGAKRSRRVTPPPVKHRQQRQAVAPRGPSRLKSPAPSAAESASNAPLVFGKAEQSTLGKFGDNAGKPNGMKTADGSLGFRVEYDARNGAHINVWAGKEKGPHFTFEGNQSTVDAIAKQFEK